MVRRGGLMSDWSVRSAILGGFGWVAVVLTSASSHAPIGSIEQPFLLAPLVIVPLGLGLAQRLHAFVAHPRLYRFVRLLQPVAAILVVISFWLPSGLTAAGLIVGWMLMSGLIGWIGFKGFVRGGLARADTACINAGLLYLPIGAAWLICSRLGWAPLGFEEPIVLLTAVHFHFTGFAAPLIAAATGHSLDRSRVLARFLFRVAAAGVVAGPPLIAAGFVLSPTLKVVSVLCLAVSLWVLALLLVVALFQFRHWLAQALLGVCAGSIVLGMWLAVVYAVGEFTGQLWIAIPQMARTHGVLNAFGFTLCGLLGWLLAYPNHQQRASGGVVG